MRAEEANISIVMLVASFEGEMKAVKLIHIFAGYCKVLYNPDFILLSSSSVFTSWHR
jgi:hypothetical protein